MIPAIPEFSRRLNIEQIGRVGLEQVVEADAAERQALAARLDVPAIGALVCRLRVSPTDSSRSGVFVADGRLTARVVRTCVVTLDEFEGTVDEVFHVYFVPATTQEASSHAWLDPEADDEIPYHGSTIDLGEAATEQLALALDPYPRKPGGELPAETRDDEASPFAGPAGLRRSG